MRTTATLLIFLFVGVVSTFLGCKSDKGPGSSSPQYEVTCTWGPERYANLKLDRHDLNITVKGDPADCVVLLYKPDGELVSESAFRSPGNKARNKITADEMRLSGQASRTVDFSYVEKAGTYSILVRRQGKDEVLVRASVNRVRKSK